jgi:hypothetical protein
MNCSSPWLLSSNHGHIIPNVAAIGKVGLQGAYGCFVHADDLAYSGEDFQAVPLGLAKAQAIADRVYE